MWDDPSPPVPMSKEEQRSADVLLACCVSFILMIVGCLIARG